MTKDYEVFELNWSGITIEIGWLPEYLTYCDGTNIGQLEIQSLEPKGSPLPMSETGYRAICINEEELEYEGGALTFVETWLARESRKGAAS